MNKKIDYSLKFYKGQMTNTNQESYKFYLAGRSMGKAKSFLENYVKSHSSRYHIIPNENEIDDITLVEVTSEDYGKEYGYEVIN